jgi:hypothetical protein
LPGKPQDPSARALNGGALSRDDIFERFRKQLHIEGRVHFAINRNYKLEQS